MIKITRIGKYYFLQINKGFIPPIFFAIYLYEFDEVDIIKQLIAIEFLKSIKEIKDKNILKEKALIPINVIKIIILIEAKKYFDDQLFILLSKAINDAIEKHSDLDYKKIISQIKIRKWKQQL